MRAVRRAALTIRPSRAARLDQIDRERREAARLARLERIQLERLRGSYVTREEALAALCREAMPPPGKPLD